MPGESTMPLAEWALPLLMVLAVVFFGFIAVLSIRGKIARRRAAEPDPAERIASIKARYAAADDASATEARLVDTARRLAAQLDDKAILLERLIADADDRLAALRAAQDAEPAPVSVSPPVPAPAPVPVPPPVPAPAPDPLTRSVYDLADEGASAVDIARHLDEQIGKVELILALRERA